MQKPKSTFSAFSSVLVFVALAIIGLAMIPLLNIQLNPSRSTGNVNISYQWPGASARNVEQEVTSKLESMFSTMTGLKNISSVSDNGSGRINLSFKKSTDLDAVRFELATIIRRVYPQLPLNMTYPAISLGTAGSKAMPVITYTLAAASEPFFIQKYAEENIAPKIARIQGVNDVRVYGSSPFEYEISFDLLKTQSLGLTGNDITMAVNNWFSKEQVGMAWSDLENKGDENEYSVSFQSDMNMEVLEWSKIPIKKQHGRIIHLSDLARVRYKEKLPDSYHRINGLNTINMVIYAGEGANNIKLADEVKSEVGKLRQALPNGYSIILAYDATQFLKEELTKIALRTLYSVLILLAFVWFISRKLRYLFFIASSLFLNLILAVIFYYLLGLEIHLYSLAGITVSFGIILDNSIVMIDHYRYHRDKKVFLAILAATLTTIGSLCVIFFLEEKQQINLIDFTWVMIVNLTLSLFIALFFIPSIQELAPLKTKKNKVFFRRKRRIVKLSNVYTRLIIFLKRWRWAFIVLFILGFGIPVHWLPDKLQKENTWGEIYNKTLGSEFYKNIRPTVEKILGGSLRLFSQNVYEKSFYSDPQRTSLHVNGNMPEGCTVQQMDESIRLMENFLSTFDEIEIYETNVYSYNNAHISIVFRKEFENGSFPYYLKEELISKANNAGGADWGVYGVGQGFSNAIHTGNQDNQIELNGYNYEQLYKYAQILCDSLGQYDRVRDLEISGTNAWNSKVLHEFVIDFNKENLALQDIGLREYAQSLAEEAYSRELIPIFEDGEKKSIRLISDKAKTFDKWKLDNEPVRVGEKTTRFSFIGSVEKRKTGNSIFKNNQEYRLYVIYNYIGPYQLARMVAENTSKSMNEWLPLGYKTTIPDFRGSWGTKDKNQYYLIFLVIGIIYFLCAILLESLLQPLAVISLIPLSFIGVFLTFYLFGFNFDQGGYAAFILLCGLSVNSALYIINDFNNFMKENKSASRLKVYVKAFNHKIIPVILTILSTVMGLIPFVIGGKEDVFWFAFAVGAISGLLFSLVALVVYFPLFVRMTDKR